jgi:hypothetical protein
MNKLELDIYDFDKTIVPFDSGTLFVVYCMAHYPWCLITLPIVAVAGLLMLLNIITFTQFKKTCFMFFPLIPKKRAVKKFWDKYESKVHTWFKDKNRFSVVISASPDFLLSEIAQRLSFDKLICTRHNYKNGMIIGENCRDEEKVKRFFEEFDKSEVTVVDVYSDSIKHDRPIFSLAENQCYHIVDSEKIPFKYSDVYK